MKKAEQERKITELRKRIAREGLDPKLHLELINAKRALVGWPPFVPTKIVIESDRPFR